MSITIIGPDPKALYPYEAWLQGPISDPLHSGIAIGDAGNTPEEAAFDCIQTWRRHNPGEIVPDYQMHYKDEPDITEEPDDWGHIDSLEVPQ